MVIKEKLVAHIETMRPYTIIWCGLVSFVGACIGFGDLPPMIPGTLSFFIPVMGWIAGLYLSDFLDAKLDAIEKPHRPIPSGRIHPYEAVVIGAVFAILGLILSFFLTINNIILVFIVALLVLTYARYTKSRGILGNITRGLVTLVAFYYGYFAAGQTPSDISFDIILLSAVFLIHDTSSNLVGAIRDIEGDKQGGYSTIPVKIGIPASFTLALLLSIIYYSFVIYIATQSNLIIYSTRFIIVFLLAIIILAIMYLSMFTSLPQISREKALRAHEYYIAERITLASAFIIGIVSILQISISIYLMAIITTLIAQYLIRSQYEFKMKP